jgi:hypothetical protein
VGSDRTVAALSLEFVSGAHQAGQGTIVAGMPGGVGLGGGRKGQERRHYREYVEAAVREGLAKSPWEELREQVVLGGGGSF